MAFFPSCLGLQFDGLFYLLTDQKKNGLPGLIVRFRSTLLFLLPGSGTNGLFPTYGCLSSSPCVYLCLKGRPSLAVGRTAYCEAGGLFSFWLGAGF